MKNRIKYLDTLEDAKAFINCIPDNIRFPGGRIYRDNNGYITVELRYIEDEKTEIKFKDYQLSCEKMINGIYLMFTSSMLLGLSLGFLFFEPKASEVPYIVIMPWVFGLLLILGICLHVCGYRKYRKSKDAIEALSDVRIVQTFI